MHINKERRDRWLRVTKNDAFNNWLGPQVVDQNGRLDLGRLHDVALEYGIDKRSQYAHLNPGQQRMNLGNMLRKAVPRHHYEGSAHEPAIATAHLCEPRPLSDVSPLALASLPELLRLHAEVMEEFRRREITRTLNNPQATMPSFCFR